MHSAKPSLQSKQIESTTLVQPVFSLLLQWFNAHLKHSREEEKEQQHPHDDEQTVTRAMTMIYTIFLICDEIISP